MVENGRRKREEEEEEQDEGQEKQVEKPIEGYQKAAEMSKRQEGRRKILMQQRARGWRLQ